MQGTERGKPTLLALASKSATFNTLVARLLFEMECVLLAFLMTGDLDMISQRLLGSISRKARGSQPLMARR